MRVKSGSSVNIEFAVMPGFALSYCTLKHPLTLNFVENHHELRS
jgi:hypothetical protein